MKEPPLSFIDFDDNITHQYDAMGPGLRLRHADSSATFKDSDLELLKARLELEIGKDKVKKIEFAPHKMEVYVELQDVAGINLIEFCVHLG